MSTSIPFKRARTTGTYLAVAAIGTESDRALIRDAVDVAHRQVRSTSSSPVSYNAFDPKLQLWVASCLYRYFVDQHEFLHGPLDLDDPARRRPSIATPSGWAPRCRCRSACGRRTGPRSTSIGSAPSTSCASTRRCGSICTAWPRWRFYPWPLRALGGPFNLFATTGFLAPEFRAMMELEWTQAQQRRFEWLLSALRLADRLIPHRAWIFGYQLYLWDMRFRARRGRRIV